MADGLRPDGVRVMVGACLDLAAGAPPYAALIAAFRSVDPPAVQVLDALTGAIGMRRRRELHARIATVLAAGPRPDAAALTRPTSRHAHVRRHGWPGAVRPAFRG